MKFIFIAPEIPLPPKDSCRLIAQNLYSYVVNPFTDKAYFDWELFEKNTRIAARLADNLVDLEIELLNRILAKIDQDPEDESIKAVERELWQGIRKTAEEVRRCGLGLTALGDCLAGLNLRYGSDESLEFVDKLGQKQALAFHCESIDMAEERGAFPIWDIKERDDEYLNQVVFKYAPLETLDKYREFGRRNLAGLTIAPTGSVSTLTQTTSGCEPVFMIQYKRNRKMMDGEAGTPDFVDAVGDRWTSYLVDHHGFSKFKEITGVQDPEASPYWKSTSADVDWMASVKIQAILQKYIDHSISKTCNLPNDATKELVGNVYLEAYRQGCKGFTVYRDGCRTGVLVSAEEKMQKDRLAKPRPPVLEAKAYVSMEGNHLCRVTFLGLLNGAPYEVFTKIVGNQLKAVIRSVDTLYIRKNKDPEHPGKTTYSLLANTDQGLKVLIENLLNESEQHPEDTLTRLVSLSLRHGATPQFIAEQLFKTRDPNMYSLHKVIGRALKEFIPDGTVAKKSLFEECETPSICNPIYADGCITCNQCGKSKCN